MAALTATAPRPKPRSTSASPAILAQKSTNRTLETDAMSDNDTKVPLPELDGGNAMQTVEDATPLAPSGEEATSRGAADLEAVFDVPVQVSAVLGRATLEAGEVLKLGPGAVL